MAWLAFIATSVVALQAGAASAALAEGPSPGAALPPTQHAAQGARVDEAVRRHVARGFSGVVLVARGPEPILLRGYGSLNGEPVSAGDRFWLASTAKQFTSAAIFRLVEQRRIALDDPLSRVFPGAPPDKAGITVRQLLTHTSGLGQSYVSEGLRDRDTAVRRMLAEPLKARPGAGFRYSNSNTQLAAAVVEVASGVPYPEFVSRYLWLEAGLTDTGFAGPQASLTVSPIQRGELPPRLRQGFWGEQGVFSTAGDLFRWYRTLGSGKILTPGSVDAMFAPAIDIGEGQATAGWFRGASQAGNPVIFVRGNEDFGANSLLYAYPRQDVAVIVLTHAGNADAATSWSRLILGEIEQIMKL